MEAICSSERSVETRRTTRHISQKMILFITTAVKTSNPTKNIELADTWLGHRAHTYSGAQYVARMYPCIHTYVYAEVQPLKERESRAIICCWPSPAQSILVSGPVGTHDHIFVPSKTTCVFWNRAFSLTREGGLTATSLPSRKSIKSNNLYI
jgi:hypothetical protein